MSVIQAEHGTDQGAIRRINGLAFGGEEEANLVYALPESADFIPELSRLTIIHGESVGHVMFSRIEIETDTAGVPALALATVAVVPERQNQGIGATLIEEALSECRRLGHQFVVVIGHPVYYPRFGSRPARDVGIDTTWPVPDSAFMVLELEAGVFDGVHGVVRYPAVVGGGAAQE